jgi:hypothetical protein
VGPATSTPFPFPCFLFLNRITREIRSQVHSPAASPARGVSGKRGYGRFPVKRGAGVLGVFRLCAGGRGADELGRGGRRRDVGELGAGGRDAGGRWRDVGELGAGGRDSGRFPVGLGAGGGGRDGGGHGAGELGSGGRGATRSPASAARPGLRASAPACCSAIFVWRAVRPSSSVRQE